MTKQDPEQQLTYLKEVLLVTRGQLQNSLATSAELEVAVRVLQRENEALQGKLNEYTERDGDR
jgi:hypothetical protein